MAVSKEFLELVSKDAAVKEELNGATFKALLDLLKDKGFAKEAAKAVDTAMTAVAEAHGFKPEAMEEVNEDELKAVAGGKHMSCWHTGEGSGKGWSCKCSEIGAGAGLGACACVVKGDGEGLDD